MSIDPKFRIPLQQNGKGRKVEKWLLREAFKDKYLPDSILWRKKEAFSDGVSSQDKSWYEIIQESLKDRYTDEDIKEGNNNDDQTIIISSKEGLYYKQIFDELFNKDMSHVIPYYWMPKWCGDIKDPSARVLDVYK